MSMDDLTAQEIADYCDQMYDETFDQYIHALRADHGLHALILLREAEIFKSVAHKIAAGTAKPTEGK